MSTKQYQTIKVERPEEGIAIVSLNRPQRLNAATNLMLDEMYEALEELRDDRSAKVCIIKGEGRTFCSGWDLDEARKDFVPRADTTGIFWEELDLQIFKRHTKLLHLLWESPVVSIAQVHGYCVETGLSIASLCDVVFAADDAKFMFRPMGGAAMLWHLWPWTVGLRKAKQILFRGEYITGKEAEEMGMINGSVPLESLDETTMRWARRFAERAREFLYLDKVSVNTAYEAMGLWDSLNSTAHFHVLSHLTQPSRDLNEKIRGAPKAELREVWDKRASPYARKVE